MGSFKAFLNEDEDLLKMINHELLELDADEVDMLGHVIFDEFFDEDNETSDDFFTIDDVNDMVLKLDASVYPYILDLLDVVEDPDETPVSQQQSPDVNEDELSEAELDEAVSRRMTNKTFNRSKRKFMTNSKADLRKTKAQRKKANRENRSKRKRYFNANKVKISSYQKSRSAAINKGKHKIKIRRKA